MAMSTGTSRLARRWTPVPAAIAVLRQAAGWPGRVRRARRIMRSLGGLADHELRDIGLTRHDLACARALPLGADPSAALRRRVEECRRR